MLEESGDSGEFEEPKELEKFEEPEKSGDFWEFEKSESQKKFDDSGHCVNKDRGRLWPALVFVCRKRTFYELKRPVHTGFR
ncbi:MAG: hypothetical protein PUG16_00665 [Lachnospiraceae bacterium]|jgi:hypothetical protein|nr:hypothetical protein [Lachnospiraceae bacterium]